MAGGDASAAVDPDAAAAAAANNNNVDTTTAAATATTSTAAATTALDLTNEHLHTLEGVDLPDTLETIDLTANRLKEIDERILSLPNLRKLSLRQNLLSDASSVSRAASAPHLEELVLHDNELAAVPDLSRFPALRRLELSYNDIRSLAPLSCDSSSPSSPPSEAAAAAAAASSVPGPRGPGASLEELYVAANKVTRIEGLENFSKIEVLELGSNRLRAVEGIGHLGATLRELWLGRNRIESSDSSSFSSSSTSTSGNVPPPPPPLPLPPPSSSSLFKGLVPLTRLERLSLQSNRLASMRDLPPLPALRELYLSHNGIRRLEGLEGFPRLRVLDASSNAIEDASDLAKGSRELTDLWLNDNRIGGGGGGGNGGGDADANANAPTTVDAAVLRHLRASGSDGTITCLYLARNPVSVDAPAGLLSRRPVAAAASAAAASALRRSGGGGSGSGSGTNAGGDGLTAEEAEGQRKRAARAAFVRELAAALPALEELDGDDLPAGARV